MGYWVLFFGGALIPAGAEICHTLVWTVGTSLSPASFMGMLLIPNLAPIVALGMWSGGNSTLIKSGWIVVGFTIASLTIDWAVLALRPLKFYPIPETMAARMA